MRKPKAKGSKVKAKPLPIEVNEEECNGVLRNVSERNMHHRIAILISWEAGLRISEVVNLKPEDFDFDSDPKSIRVNMGKNSKDRIVPMPKNIRPHHMKYIPIKCKQRALQKAFIQASEKSGLKVKKPKVHFHSLRHGFATHCLRRDIKLPSIQGHLGHEDLSTTATYLNLAPQERLREYDDKF